MDSSLWITPLSPSMVVLPQRKVADADYAALELRLLIKQRSAAYRFQQGVKRLLDVVLSTVGLLVILPVLLMVALAIKLTSRGPILYSSLRVGQHQKPVQMLKFRTM